MQKTVFINGGAGRMICALPALERFIQENPDGYIVTEAGLDFVWGNRILQDRTLEINTKGLFENIIRKSQIIAPEPYRDYDYYNQNLSISQTFDKLINGSVRENFDYRPNIILNKEEELNGVTALKHAKDEHKKEKTIVIQPFGRSSTNDSNLGVVVDYSTRSLEMKTYMAIARALREQYNVISMSEFAIPGDDISVNPKQLTLRKWAAIIEHADYFIGCDSVGQHLAYSMKKPGSVILGSTFAVNVSYPNYFNIIEKQGVEKRYSPIRISEFGCYEAHRFNDMLLEFDDTETADLINNIMTHIKRTIGE
jgi:hypothetical protein